ncbi:MAG TPA: hypothetical protein VGQ62_15725 [Chloroflexota bacterium]|nr:hypothetical protein [Chloroflexota bacterium]
MRRHTSLALSAVAPLRLILTISVLCATPAGTALADQPAWEQWQHVPGIVDLAARSDGRLVGMASGRFFTLTRDGQSSPFATASDGYTGATPDAESYFVVVPALTVDAAGCSFNADDVFVLDLTTPPGVARVDPQGHASRFATLSSVDTLGGIASDTTGLFGHRLLVTGSRNNQTSVFAIDCAGGSTTLTNTAPPLEGGIAVAPATFGQFAGTLIAPDENTGQLWAIDPSGRATVVIVPSLPTGGDTGVESIGFVPPGFSSGGFAYLADRGTPNNPFPGTDSILRLSAAALTSAGVQDGDLLVSTEGNGTTVAIRCAATCTVISAATGTNGGHIEGHVVVVADQPT